MLNIAGPEYDFGHVVFAVIQECEHRRRGVDDKKTDEHLMSIARAKLAQIKAAYDEFGGSSTYWSTLQTEVLETAMPQYIPAAKEMNALERSGWDVYRRGDLAARGLFGLGGLLIGIFVKALPLIPTIENMFVFALAAAGVMYPDLVRYMHERRHSRTLNRIVSDAAQYQQNAKLHYMTTRDIRDSFAIGEPSALNDRHPDSSSSLRSESE
jgi:hypothetical protein